MHVHIWMDKQNITYFCLKFYVTVSNIYRVRREESSVLCDQSTIFSQFTLGGFTPPC